MTNYWDFPIYIVILSVVIIVKNLIFRKINLNNLIKIFLILLEVIIIEELITLPFSLDLVVNSAKLYFTHITSPFYKLAVLWGLQTLCVTIFFILFLFYFKKSNLEIRKYLIAHLNDLFIIILGICAIGLVITPELIYLKDIYGDEYKRFNTMFKLTYQSFILFCICTNYIIYRFILFKHKPIAYLGITLLLLNTTTFGYGIDTIIQRNKSLSYTSIAYAQNSLKNNMPEDYTAVQWIKNNIDSSKIILEASTVSSSYTNYSRISVFTGNPTVLGWMAHEWIWRFNKDYSIPDEISLRNNDILYFYTANNLNEAKKFIDTYNIDYIYIGNLEYETYKDLNLDLLLSLGDVVYNSSSTYIIKVTK